MTSAIKVIQPGIYTTVQDAGRYGYSHLGVPVSGVMDKQAYLLANALLNNPADAAVLECTLVGPTLKFLENRFFVLTGARVEATLEGKPVPPYTPTLGARGQVLKLSNTTGGCRTYIAIDGGIATTQVLGSRSWYFPITDIGQLAKDMLLPLGSPRYGGPKGATIKLPSSKIGLEAVVSLETFMGPDYEKLTKKQLDLLAFRAYTISRLWNRMAIQLEEKLENSLDNMYTSPVLPGTVQLTPDGTLIVLMNDCQATGGYPRVLQISERSLGILSQMQTGNNILFSIT